MAVEQIVKKFGKIDILINNASAIVIENTENITSKKYDLSHEATSRGTFMVSKYCIPHLRKSTNPHILNLSPPLTVRLKWFENLLPYLIQKWGMSMCVLGMSEEFRADKIAVNALWPRTTIATSVITNVGGGEEMIATSMSAEMMADATYFIITNKSDELTG